MKYVTVSEQSKQNITSNHMVELCGCAMPTTSTLPYWFNNAGDKM